MFAGEKLKQYHVFHSDNIKDYLAYVSSLPEEENPNLMGLHENANIIQALQESGQIFGSILSLQSSE